MVFLILSAPLQWILMHAMKHLLLLNLSIFLCVLRCVLQIFYYFTLVYSFLSVCYCHLKRLHCKIKYVLFYKNITLGKGYLLLKPVRWQRKLIQAWKSFVLKWRKDLSWTKARRLATACLSGPVHLKHPKRGMKDDYAAVHQPCMVFVGFCRLMGLLWVAGWTRWPPEIPSKQFILWWMLPLRYPDSGGSAQRKTLFYHLWTLVLTILLTFAMEKRRTTKIPRG